MVACRLVVLLSLIDFLAFSLHVRSWVYVFSSGNIKHYPTEHFAILSFETTSKFLIDIKFANRPIFKTANCLVRFLNIHISLPTYSDLKPDNILVQHRSKRKTLGEVPLKDLVFKLADFGVARALPSSAQSDGMAGTAGVTVVGKWVIPEMIHSLYFRPCSHFTISEPHTSVNL